MTDSNPVLVAEIFDAAKCRRAVRNLRPKPGERFVELLDGPLAGERLSVEPHAAVGAIVGVTQLTRLGVIEANYRKQPNGEWRFDGLKAVGW